MRSLADRVGSRTVFTSIVLQNVRLGSSDTSSVSMGFRIFAFLALVFAVLTTVNAMNKGGDAAVFFEGGRRFLNAEPLYAGSSAAAGFIGPPFQAMFFTPFAAVSSLSPVAARLIWHALSVACLALSVAMTVGWWNAAREHEGLAPRSWLALAGAPLAAVLLPLLTNFEHQNLNAILLALLTAATWQLTLGSALVAGALVGAATALKVFPALVILYFIARRYWAAATVAALTAGGLSVVVPLGVYGVNGFVDLAQTFWRLSTSGWPVRGNNQSLVAAIDRLTSGANHAGVRLASEAPITMTVFVLMALLLLCALLAVMREQRSTRMAVAVEMTAVTVLAILLSPIAWDHYWTLLFPACVIAYDSRDRRLLGRAGAYAFWVAAILTTGLSPLTLGGAGFNVARHVSMYTIAAIVIYLALLALRRRVKV